MGNEIQFGIRVGYDGKLAATGAASTRDEIKQIGESAKRSGAEASQALDRTAISAKQTAAALRGVPAQFTDIFTSIAAGQNPMQVMLQQGGQLKDMFGGTAPAVRALGGYIAGLVNPYTIAAAAAGGLAFAYHQGAKESDAYTRALILSGNAAGATAAQLAEAARRVAAATGGTQGAAAEALTLAVGAGIPGAALDAVADAAVRMEQVTGKAIDDTVAEFAKLARDPVAASIKLSEQYNYLTLEVYRQIKALEEQGRHTEAVELAMKTYAGVVAERSGEITKSLGVVEDKWLGIKTATLGALDAVFTWRPQDDKLTAAVDKVLAIQKKIRDAEKPSILGKGATGFTSPEELARLDEQLVAARAHMVAVRDEINANNAAATAKAKVNEQNREAIKLAEEEARKKRALRTAKPGRGFDPEGDLEFAIDEAQRKAAQKSWLEWEKELAREAAAAEKEWSDAAKRAQQDMEKRLDSLDAQAVKTELEVANYGLSAAAIERNTIARLEDRRAIDAGIDGLEDSVAALDREIEARKRLAAAAGSRDAIDANKRATEAMQRDWERMHEQISQSLTDELMKGGQDAGELLERYFKTLVLRPVIQGVVNAGVSAVGQVLGFNTGGAGGGSAGGGISNLLSLGSNVSSLGGISAGYAGFATSGIGSALGLGSATAAGYSAPVFASALEGGALLSAGSGTAAGGLSSLGAGIGTALPYIGAAIAIASILGGAFGKKSPAPIEWGLVDTPASFSMGGFAPYTEQGPFSAITTPGQHLSRNGMSLSALQAQVTHPLVELDKVLAPFLSAAETTRVSMGLYLGNEGEHGWSQASVEGVMMRRLNRISDAIGGWVDKLADTTTGNLQERYTQLAQILSIRGDAEVEKLANDMFNATGKWSYDQFAALQAGIARFDDMFKTDADRLADYTAAMSKAFESLNVVLPESRDGFKSLVEGIDTSTTAGFNLYTTLLDLSPTMAAYYDALSQELDVKNKLTTTMNEGNFSTAVDYRRYQRVSANYDPTFAGDYAYNISLGTIKPGAAANDDLVAEIRALRADMRARDVALALPTQYTADTLRRWNLGGMPETRAP
jgi:hypothetical protein